MESAFSFATMSGGVFAASGELECGGRGALVLPLAGNAVELGLLPIHQHTLDGAVIGDDAPYNDLVPFLLDVRNDRLRREVIDRIERQWDEHGWAQWALEIPGEASFIGYTGLWPADRALGRPAVEVGWRLDRRFWGLGYATEGASAALDAAFATLELTNVCSLPQLGNHRSIRVADRLGMRRTRIVELPRTEQRGSVRACVYEITASEWRG